MGRGLWRQPTAQKGRLVTEATCGRRSKLPAGRSSLGSLGLLLLVGPASADPPVPERAAVRVHTPGRAASPPLSEAERADAARVQRAYIALFGEPIPEGGLRVSAAGRVALPMAVELDPTALAAEHAREGLDTPARKEKATVALGPKGAYTHFLGTDPAGSDLWGTPDAIIAWMRLAAGWSARCRAGRAEADAKRCTLQVGDIAWYEDARPDPLGHKDHRGDCFDLRLMRRDASAYEAWWNRPDDRPGFDGPQHGYDAALTAELVRYARAEHGVTVIFFNDPAVTGARPLAGHDDHVHLCMPTAPPVTTER